MRVSVSGWKNNLSMRNDFNSLAAMSSLQAAEPFKKAGIENVKDRPIYMERPKATMYICIFAIWVASLMWFDPKLFQLLQIATGPLHLFSLSMLIVFINFAWLYGIYNLAVVSFAVYYKASRKKTIVSNSLTFASPRVAILYTTANDFVAASAESCLRQSYPNFMLYLLDDSSDESYKAMVDEFAARDPKRIQVVRRPDRKGFKAGNLN